METEFSTEMCIVLDVTGPSATLSCLSRITVGADSRCCQLIVLLFPIDGFPPIGSIECDQCRNHGCDA